MELGEDGFEAAWREGAEMTSDQALDYALDRTRQTADGSPL